MNNTLRDLLDNSSTDEKKEILRALVTDLARASGQQTIPIEDDAGKVVGVFTPIAPNGVEGDFFCEGTPGFFRELERRRASAENLLSADEALARLRGEAKVS